MANYNIYLTLKMGENLPIGEAKNQVRMLRELFPDYYELILRSTECEIQTEKASLN